MGFDSIRFVCEVDDEFQCSICVLILEDPVQTPCEHSFCEKCIKDWLLIKQSCPVDHKELTFGDLKPPSRPFRNLWNKLDIKCDFQPQGCSDVVKLESLRSHVATCEYNLMAEVVCDKGCYMTITRGEYKNNNCFSHLANRVTAQENENMKVRNELDTVQEQLSILQKQLADQKEHFEQIVNDQLDEIRVLCSDLSSSRPLKWQWCFNVQIDESNILKVDSPGGISIVQSAYPLQPRHNFFKIRILALGPLFPSSWIGLNTKDHKPDLKAGMSDVVNKLFGKFIYQLLNSNVGDIIECGIKFPENFVNDEEQRAIAYITNNNKNASFEELLTIPKEGIFPMVVISGKDTKFRYCQ